MKQGELFSLKRFTSSLPKMDVESSNYMIPNYSCVIYLENVKELPIYFREWKLPLRFLDRCCRTFFCTCIICAIFYITLSWQAKIMFFYCQKCQNINSFHLSHSTDGYIRSHRLSPQLCYFCGGEKFHTSSWLLWGLGLSFL